MSRKAITEKDIANYKNLLKQGKSGVDQIYQDMERKGYQSATWAKDEFR